MTDTPDNLVLKLLREMRAESTAQFEELRAQQDETNLKIETLAGSMVSMRKDINDLKKETSDLRGAIEGVRLDMRMIAIAVDGHGARLDKMEETLERFKH